MAKIGTAHVEIKPVLNEEALQAIVDRIELSVAQAVERGLNPVRTIALSDPAHPNYDPNFPG